ncbi:T9SS type A sorting domain-containing protein, partial [Flavobacterium sp.]|uniref:T9SS type A sorting domain-containing protein n=1 Tax=Flavobacterium sp. TaxID=239 RepID=UPI002B4B58FA
SAVTTGTMATALYTGTPGSLVQLTGACLSGASQDFLGLTVGTTYYARVYTTSSTVTLTTNFTVCLGTLPAPPTNDEPSGAVVLTVNPDMACAITTNGTTISATASTAVAPSCNATGINDDVWYTFTATDVAHRFVYSGVTSGTIATALYTGTPGSLVQLVGACLSGTTLNFTGLTVGTTYYARVYTTTSTVTITTDFTICLGVPPPAPINDFIANASILTESTNETCNNGLVGTTDSATHSADYICNATDLDVWYTFTPSTTGTYNFNRTITSGTGTGYISVYSGVSGALTRLNTSCTINNFALTLTAGTTYYISVASAATSTINFSLCAYLVPAAPANDLCANAVTLTAGSVFATGAVVGSTAGATTVSGLTYACQATNRSEDVWYTVSVPVSGTLTIETKQVNGSPLLDTVLSVFSGTCGSLIEIGCNDDGGDGNHSIVSLTGQTPGSTLYIGVWKFNSSASGQFQVSAFDASLSNSGFDNNGFSAYPNPVKEVLNLSYTQNISVVEVYNLLGQQVIAKTINANQSQIDMSHLSSGAYMVKVTADNQVKMIKVIKE